MSSWLTVTVVLYSLEPPRFGLRNPYSNALIVVYKVNRYRSGTCVLASEGCVSLKRLC